MTPEPRRRRIAPPVWGEFAADATSYGGRDVERTLRAAGWPRGTPWRLVWTAGYFQRGFPMLFEAIGPDPLLPGTYWHAEKPQPSTEKWDRWEGYRYLGLGVAVPSDYRWPPGSPWRAVYGPDGRVREQMLMLGQYAAAEGCAAYAVVTWDLARQQLVYNIRTIGRPATAHEAKLARKAQQLIGELSLRGRPIETPVAARARLLDGAARLNPNRRIEREGLANVIASCSSVDAVADLLARAHWTLDDLRGQFSDDPGNSE